jgi:hypothetical protein
MTSVVRGQRDAGCGGNELRDVWRTAPHRVIELAPDTPPALSQLVMELLQLNQTARPRTAAVVMERLCAIASLEPFSEPRVGTHYTGALQHRVWATWLAVATRHLGGRVVLFTRSGTLPQRGRACRS